MMRHSLKQLSKRALSVVIAVIMLVSLGLPALTAGTPFVYIGEDAFISLAAAINAADDGDEINIEYDSSFNENITIDKPVTINAEASVMTGCFTIESTGVVINDLYMNGDGGKAFTVSGNAETGLSLSGCEISGYDYAVYSDGNSGKGFSLVLQKKTFFSDIAVIPVYVRNLTSAEIKNCTFTGDSESPADAAFDFDAVNIACESILISNCKFYNYGNSDDDTTAALRFKVRGGEKDTAYTSFGAASSGTVTVDKCTFTGTGADVAVGTGYIPSTFVTVTDSGTNTGLDKITDLAHPVLPSVNVTLIKGTDFATTDVFADFDSSDIEYDPEFTVGAIYSIVDIGKGYDDWYADFVLSLSTASDAKLFGNYGTYGWCGGSEYTELLAGELRILSEAGFSSMHTTEIRDDVGTFYCLFTCDRESLSGALDAALTLKIFNPADQTESYEATTTSVSDPIVLSVSSKLPTAKTELINGTDFESTEPFSDISSIMEYDADYAIGAELTFCDAGLNFDEWLTDLVLVTDKPIRAKLIGRYVGTYGGNTTLYDWQGITDYIEIPAGEMGVISDSIGEIPVKQLDNINCFQCALIIDPTSLNGEANISLDLTINDPNTTSRSYAVLTTADSTDVFKTFNAVLPDIESPKMTGTDFTANTILNTFNKPYDTTYAIGGTVTINSLGIDYDDWKIGVEISFEGDESVYGQLFGKADGGNWVSRSGNKYKTYTAVSFVKAIFPTAAGTVADFSAGSTYAYAFIADRSELFSPMTVTVQTYLYSDDGLFCKALGEPETVTLRDELPTCNFTSVKASEFSQTAVFSELTKTYSDNEAIGASFAMADSGMGYDDYYADFVIKVTGGNLTANLFGNYGTYGWIDMGECTFLDGEEYKIVNMPAYTTVAYLRDYVGTFYCALATNEDEILTNIRVTLSLKLYSPVGAPDPSEITVCAPLVKDLNRILLDIKDSAEEDGTVRKIFSGDTPETIANALLQTKGNDIIGAEISVISKSGTERATDERVGTGDKVQIIKGNLTTEYTVVIYGDVDGDGLINESDAESTVDLALSVPSDSASLAAADVYSDGVVDVFDVFVFNQHENGNISDGDFHKAFD